MPATLGNLKTINVTLVSQHTILFSTITEKRITFTIGNKLNCEGSVYFTTLMEMLKWSKTSHKPPVLLSGKIYWKLKRYREFYQMASFPFYRMIWKHSCC